MEAELKCGRTETRSRGECSGLPGEWTELLDSPWYRHRADSRVLADQDGGGKGHGKYGSHQHKVPSSHRAHTHQLTVWGSCPMLPEVRE